MPHLSLVRNCKKQQDVAGIPHGIQRVSVDDVSSFGGP